MRKDAKISDGAIIERVNRERLAEDLWKLVRIPSPSRHERQVALTFADMLEKAGAEVKVDSTLPDSPNVIGTLFGKHAGRVLQLAGHLDHIDVAHDEPKRTTEIISGRGSADMKCGIAGILEIVRILNESDREFSGQLLVTAYGLHEAPLGRSEGIRSLIERRILGDAAIVFEAYQDQANVMGNGQSIWNIELFRKGDVCHELKREPEADNLLVTMNNVIQRLLEKNSDYALEDNKYPLLPSQSVFVGQVHYGDFYNRTPKQASLQGTWRWHPNRSFEYAQGELKTLLSKIDLPTNIKIEDSWMFVGESFAFDAENRIVHSLQDAYSEVTGKTMAIAGSSEILDVNHLVHFGNIPAVSVSLDGHHAHADYEYVELKRMELGCRLALKAVVNYFSGS